MTWISDNYCVKKADNGFRQFFTVYQLCVRSLVGPFLQPLLGQVGTVRPEALLPVLRVLWKRKPERRETNYLKTIF